MKIFAAGSGSKNLMYQAQCLGINKLYSALNEKRQIEDWPGHDQLLVDSGAHSWNKSNITGGYVGTTASAKGLPKLSDWMVTYKAMLNNLKDTRHVFVELDCYGVITVEEADEWVRSVYEESGKRLMRVYHPVLDGGTCEKLEEWIEEGYTYLGIGNDALPVLDKVFQITKDKIKLHGFALTKHSVLYKYPFYSVDSTTIISGLLYGGIFEYPLKFTGKDKLIKRQRRELAYDNDMNSLHSFDELIKVERMFTDLWSKRNVIWK